MIWYVDTSAALKLVVEEVESSALARDLTAFARRSGNDLVSSMLLFAELHCAADRRLELPVAAVNSVIDGVSLVDLERVDLERAGTSRWGLRSAAAIHLACALRLEADGLVAYDHELQAAATSAGLTVIAPA